MLLPEESIILGWECTACLNQTVDMWSSALGTYVARPQCYISDQILQKTHWTLRVCVCMCVCVYVVTHETHFTWLLTKRSLHYFPRVVKKNFCKRLFPLMSLWGLLSFIIKKFEISSNSTTYQTSGSLIRPTHDPHSLHCQF